MPMVSNCNRLRAVTRGGWFILGLCCAMCAALGQAQTSGNADDNFVPPESPIANPCSASLLNGQSIPLTQGASMFQYSGGRTTTGGPALQSQLLYGGTFSAIFMQDYGTSSIQQFVDGIASPYIGIYAPTHTGGITVQYSGEFSPVDAFTSTFQAFHTFSLTAVGAITHRWFWGISGTGSYGSDAVQFEGPLPSLIVDLVPVISPVEPAEFFIGRTIAFADDAVEIGWLGTNRDRFTITGFHEYSDISSSSLAGGLSGNQSNALGSKFQYSRDVTPRFEFNLYGQQEHTMTDDCDQYGGGAGISARLTYTWHLDVNGGPEWTSAACGNQSNYNFYGALIKEARGKAQFYLVGWQDYDIAYQTPNSWEDAAAIGFAKPLGENWSIESSVGYSRGDPLIQSSSPLEGYYASPLLRRKLTDATSLSFGYRLFHPTAGNTVGGNLNFAVVSLEWSPGPFHLGR
jgi:hypothetical protein